MLHIGRKQREWYPGAIYHLMERGLPSNQARFESGTRIPTLVVLEKYAAALGKRIELQLSDEE